MKLFSRDGQTMVEANEIWLEDDKIVMQCKLMQAYSMPVILTKEELRKMVDLLNWDLIKAIPGIMFDETVGKKVYDHLKEYGQLSDSNKLFELGMAILKLALIGTDKK